MARKPRVLAFARMKTTRLEAFSDGVLAIIITIMVLELKVPHAVELAALKPMLPVIVELRAELHLSRHLLEQPSSSVPSHGPGQRRNSLGQPASALLAVALSIHDGVDGRESSRLNADRRIRFRSTDGSYRLSNSASTPSSPRRAATRFWRGRLAAIGRVNSLLCFIFAAIPLAFVSPWIAGGLYVFAALLWLIPDPRIERKLEKREE